MLLTDIEQIILEDVHKKDIEGGKITIDNYPLKETENDKRTKEFANHLMRLKKLGYISLEGVFVEGGREDEVYHNNVKIVYTEKIKITGKGIEYIRGLATQDLQKNNLQIDHLHPKDKFKISIEDGMGLDNLVLITKSNDTSSNLNKPNRQRIADWINEIIPLFSDESAKYALNIIKDRLHDKFDVQWSIGNNKKNSVHLYASNDYTTVYAYLKVEGGQLKSQGPRGIDYENGKVKAHKCIHETKRLTIINERNAYQFTDILLKALENSDEIINKNTNYKEEEIGAKSNINIDESEEIDSILKITSIASDTSNGPDLLNITKDVVAVSNLIALHKLNTPLSIGLFGNWGSGKSFFMNKMQDTIKEIEGIVKNLNKKAKNNISLNEKENQYKELFCDSIIQIRFNAWHYVDANLWASLVSHIFEEISNKISNKDNSNIMDEIKLPFMEEFESTKELKRQLVSKKDIYKKIYNVKENELKNLDEKIKQKEKEKSNIKISEIVLKLVKEENVSDKISEIFPDAKELPDSINKLLEAKNDFADTVKDTEGIIKKFINTFSLLSNKDRFLICIVFIIFILFNIFINFIPVDITTYLGIVIKGAIGLISFATSILGFVNIKPIKNFRVKAKKWCDYLNDLAQKQTSLLRQQEYQLSQQLTEIIKEKEKVEKESKKIEEKIDYIKSEIEEIEKGKYIKYFIEKRLSSMDYQQHLGIINLIRKDFEVLSFHLKNGSESENYKIDRVILYIDDLDRCPPEKVVQVLQAIHLILSFELFVVVVAVDVRWISKCLCENYKLLFRENNNQRGASPYDYLEKIFQIPIKLQQVGPENSKQYINSLIAESLAIYMDENGTDLRDTESESIHQVQDSLNQNMEQEEDLPDIYDEFQTVVITKEDIRDIDEFTPILGNTPRTIKRFVNIYRLIKAGYPNLKNNRNILFLVSVITGLPYISMDIFTEIQRNIAGNNIKELINIIGDNLQNSKEKSDRLKEIELSKIKLFLSSDNCKDISVAELKPLVPIIGRYSFHLDDLS